MKRIAYVLLDKYADWEIAYISAAVNMLGNGEFENITVSPSKDAVTSIGGLRCIPDFDVCSCPENYDALILIGGMSWRSQDAQKVKPLVEDCVSKGKLLGAICDASSFLGKIGMLNDVYHTSNDLNDLKKWTAYTGETHYLARQAVRDKNVVTANGTAALEFAREILLALNVADKEKICAFYDFHKLGFYTAPLPEM